MHNLRQIKPKIIFAVTRAERLCTEGKSYDVLGNREKCYSDKSVYFIHLIVKFQNIFF